MSEAPDVMADKSLPCTFTLFPAHGLLFHKFSLSSAL